MADAAGATQIGYEPANALGTLWQVAPKLAARLAGSHNYASAVQTYLRALDFYCAQRGIPASRLRIHTVVRDGAIVQRISG